MPTKPPRSVFFIFGFGYTAEALANRLTSLGFEVVGTTSTAKKRQSPHQLIDFFAPEVAMHLQKATHVLVTIPPVDGVPDVVLSYYGELIKRYASSIQWLGYLSSTGVYGDHHGEWVDETSPCLPQSNQGLLRLQAENAWMALARQRTLPLHVFRLAGIYGPQRNALERILAGKQYSIYKKGQVFSRIHVDDIVSVVLQSMQHPNPLSIYNVADDEPAPAHLVDAYAAQLLNRPALPLLDCEKAPLSPMEKSFYSANRQVSNWKIKKELNILLRFPSFREGLKEIQQSLSNTPKGKTPP
ncbi:MAG: SDR family oxidoreductase [Tatlockia sp.]|jgi:nucleoside-diphosphate-sugar epimerase